MCREPEILTQGDLHPANERRKPGTEPGTAIPGHGGGWGGTGGGGEPGRYNWEFAAGKEML